MITPAILRDFCKTSNKYLFYFEDIRLAKEHLARGHIDEARSLIKAAIIDAWSNYKVDKNLLDLKLTIYKRNQLIKNLMADLTKQNESVQPK